MYRYKVIISDCALPEHKSYSAYGILVEQEINGEWIRLTQTIDISCNLCFVNSLAEKCTRLQLDPIHLIDVIIDAIS